MVSSSSHTKPWLTPYEQVEHMKSKGIKFDLLSEKEAEEYLAQNNNYFRLRSYRTGFPKVEEGVRKGEYANLDFKMLVDLSIVDMLLRFELLPMTLDVEHFSKVKLLGKIEAHGEDGYGIISDYLRNCDNRDASGNVLNQTIADRDKGKSSVYVASLLDKYPKRDYPVWVFLEVVSFGTFIHFLKFCADRFNDKKMKDEFYLLQTVKGLRNACAQNNCIMNDLVSGSPTHKVSNSVSRAVGGVKGVGKGMRQSKLNNERIQQITTTLYMHSLIASEGVRSHRAVSLAEFKERMNKHSEYYSGNCQIVSFFDYLSKLIEAWFPLQEMGSETHPSNGETA